MNELASLRVYVDRSRVPIGPAIADAEHEVGCKDCRVAVAVRGLQADHAGHQRMIVGNRAPAHQRRNDGNAGRLGEFDQQFACIRIDDAAAGDDQRALRVRQHAHRLFDLCACRRGLVHRKRRVGFDIELDLAHLHVDRKVDQYRPRAAGAHQVERLLEHARHERGLTHRDGPFRHRLGD